MNLSIYMNINDNIDLQSNIKPYLSVYEEMS